MDEARDEIKDVLTPTHDDDGFPESVSQSGFEVAGTRTEMARNCDRREIISKPDKDIARPNIIDISERAFPHKLLSGVSVLHALVFEQPTAGDSHGIQAGGDDPHFRLTAERGCEVDADLLTLPRAFQNKPYGYQ